MFRKLCFTSFILVIFFLFIPWEEARAVSVSFSSSKTYGRAGVNFGVTLSKNLPANEVSDVVHYFSAPIYLRLEDPDDNVMTTSSFQSLSSRGFKWHIYFSNNNRVQNFLTRYYQSYNNDIVVELKEFDSNFISNLKSQFSLIKIHVGNFSYWPRNEVKNILNKTSFNIIDAISLKVEKSGHDDLFLAGKEAFDVFFDASSDIGGSSGISLNYPGGAQLSLFDTGAWDTSLKASAYANANIGSAVVSSVQTQGKSGKAPFRYIVAGLFNKYSANEKMVLGALAQFLHEQPSVIWPMAIEQNGDPYDNTFFTESNSKPIMGVGGAIGGELNFLLVNASGNNATATLSTSVGGYHFVSTVQGNGVFAATTTLHFAPYETYFISPSALPTQEPSPTFVVTPTPTIVPTIAGKITTIPTSSVIRQPKPNAPGIPFVPTQTLPQSLTPPRFDSITPTPVLPFTAKGTVHIIGSAEKSVAKVGLFLYQDNDILDQIVYTDGSDLVNFNFSNLMTGSKYVLRTYVKTTDGNIYSQSNKCTHSSLLERCVIKNAEELFIEVSTTQKPLSTTIQQGVQSVLNTPVYMLKYIQNIDNLLNERISLLSHFLSNYYLYLHERYTLFYSRER